MYKTKNHGKTTRRGYWPSTFPLRDQSVCVKSYNKTRIAFIFWQKGGPPGLSRCFCALTYGGAFVSPTHMGCGVVRLDACDGGQDLRSPKILTIPMFVWMWTTTCMIWDPKSILGLTNISLIRVLFSVPKKHPDQAHFGQKSSLAWCLCFRVYYALWPKPAWFLTKLSLIIIERPFRVMRLRKSHLSEKNGKSIRLPSFSESKVCLEVAARHGGP